MYVESTHKYLHDLKMPVKSATMEIAIAIENGWSLKLRQMSHLLFFCLSLDQHQM
jgi:hypothetical protein